MLLGECGGKICARCTYVCTYKGRTYIRICLYIVDCEQVAVHFYTCIYRRTVCTYVRMCCLRRCSVLLF